MSAFQWNLSLKELQFRFLPLWMAAYMLLWQKAWQKQLIWGNIYIGLGISKGPMCVCLAPCSWAEPHSQPECVVEESCSHHWEQTTDWGRRRWVTIYCRWPTSTAYILQLAPYMKVFILSQTAPSAGHHSFTSWTFGKMVHIQSTSTRISNEVLTNHSWMSHIDAPITYILSHIKTHSPPTDFCLILFQTKNAHREEWASTHNVPILLCPL